MKPRNIRVRAVFGIRVRRILEAYEDAGLLWERRPPPLDTQGPRPLKDLESWGFVKRISTYPAIYQVTKSVTRMLGADLSVRRQHTLETIQTRLQP